MRIALDATPLGVATGGIRRYTAQLAEALREVFPEDDVLLLPEGGGHLLLRRWWSGGLPFELARRRVDVFHGTDFAVPYLPLRPAVLTLHDLSPWKSAPWRAPSRRVAQRTPFLLGLGLATMVITPSETIRREAIQRFRLHPARVAAVPLAAAHRFRPLAAPPPPEPYFLHVGTLEPRKNLALLVEAWRQVRQTHAVGLVLAGRARPDTPAPAAEPGLRLAGAVPEEDLPALYSGAVALLFPSFYEGFGLPLLEAMQCGCPVLASRDPALVEVAGGAALHEDAADARGWAAAMGALLEMPALRAERREAGLRRTGLFHWHDTARRTRQVYEEAERRFGA